MRTQVMGILNITPDSFSDGGDFFCADNKNLQHAVKTALQMELDGASIIDVGGESTRPGAKKISVQEELDRVIPVIERIHQESDITLSIDTSKAEVMAEAIRAGASFINDVCALQNKNSLQVVSTEIKKLKHDKNKKIQVCLMHMQNNPQTMQESPEYQNVVEDVIGFLQQRISACEAEEIPKENIIIDPGFGFGKSLDHNLQLIRQLSDFTKSGCPILVGLSRKKIIEQIAGSENIEPKDRLAGSLALAWACVQRGATIVRVHDVKETVDFLKVMQAI